MKGKTIKLKYKKSIFLIKKVNIMLSLPSLGSGQRPVIHFLSKSSTKPVSRMFSISILNLSRYLKFFLKASPNPDFMKRCPRVLVVQGSFLVTYLSWGDHDMKAYLPVAPANYKKNWAIQFEVAK